MKRRGAVVALSCAMIGPAHAQQQIPAPVIDSLVSENVAAMHCADRTPDLTRLCEGFQSLRRAEQTGERAGAVHADELFTRTVVDQPKWAIAWYALGLVRLQLARDTVFSKAGPLLPAGASNFLGATNVLVNALRVDPQFAPALHALARAPIPREGIGALKERVAVLRKLRAELAPEDMLPVAALERRAGHPDSAYALDQRALATGKVDSGVALLPMARDLYRLGHPQEGRDALLRGAGVDTPAAFAAYRRELQWVASPAELREWDALPPDRRSRWLADFWARRDVAEGRRDGERLVEHYRRVEYAYEHFPVTLPQTGRQQMLSFTPSMTYAIENEARKCALRNPDVFPELAREEMMSNTIGSNSTTRYFAPQQDDIDDRGVIWIRHGKPTKTASDFSDAAIEVWRYERPEGPLVLQFRDADFDGSVGAGTLIPTLLTLSPAIRNGVCYLETSLCGRSTSRTMPIEKIPRSHLPTPAMPIGPACTKSEIVKNLEAEVEAEGTALSPEAIMHAVTRGRAEIDTATTTDTWHRDFTHAVHPGVQIYALTSSSGDNPRVVLAFALPVQELAPAKNDA